MDCRKLILFIFLLLPVQAFANWVGCGASWNNNLSNCDSYAHVRCTNVGNGVSCEGNASNPCPSGSTWENADGYTEGGQCVPDEPPEECGKYEVLNVETGQCENDPDDDCDTPSLNGNFCEDDMDECDMNSNPNSQACNDLDQDCQDSGGYSGSFNGSFYCANLPENSCPAGTTAVYSGGGYVCTFDAPQPDPDPNPDDTD